MRCELVIQMDASFDRIIYLSLLAQPRTAEGLQLFQDAVRDTLSKKVCILIKQNYIFSSYKEVFLEKLTRRIENICESTLGHFLFSSNSKIIAGHFLQFKNHCKVFTSKACKWNCDFSTKKFVFSKKTTKIDKISNLDLTLCRYKYQTSNLSCRSSQFLWLFQET